MTDLIYFLKSNKSSRKIFGQREIKIIEKQLYGINLTQSEKNRLSRDIREKLKLIKELSKFEDEFRLKKGAKIKEIIEETKEVILEDELSKKIKKIFLFGSTAERQRSFRSDIDIAIEFKEINKEDAKLFMKRMFGKLKEGVHINIYNIVPDKIKKEIDEKGEVIFNGEN